jgi:WD40 repeat protein
VALQRNGEPVEVNFVLPLTSADGGAAGVPRAGCPPPPTSGATSEPRCTLAFAKPVAALATAPDATTFLVAQLDLGVSAWQLPGVFLLGFAPPPAVTLAVPEPPHHEAPNVVLVRPDGRETVVALENRLIRYSMDSGAVVKTLDGAGGIVRAATWTPNGTRLLVSVFYDPAATLLDADDGHVRSRFAVEREAAAVAVSADGRTAAVASETGPVTLFDVATAEALRTLAGPRGPVRALAFSGERLLAAGDDGILRAWETGSGELQLERQLAPTLRLMAMRSDGRVTAIAGIDPRIEIVATADGATVRTLLPADAQVTALTWVGTTLVSADSDGRIALWDNAGEPQR